MIFDRHANLKYKYGNGHFWCRGYNVDTAGHNEKAIREYVRNQLQEDIANDQISLLEYVDPFTGEQVKISNYIINVISQESLYSIIIIFSYINYIYY